MRASFERGDPSSPRGHALLFFREQLNPDQVRATYLIIAPIELDFSKYVPPMFAAQLAGLVPSGPTAMPLPPIPEPVESLAWLERLAEARADDLLDGGRIDPSNPQQMMLLTTELAGEYAALWTDHSRRLAAAAPRIDEPAAALPDVDELLLSVLSHAELVGRLAKLAGTLRYATEGQDERLATDTVDQMQRVGRRLPAPYRIDSLLDVARQPGPAAARLLELYLERCYKLAADDFEAVQHLDRQIEGQGSQAEP